MQTAAERVSRPRVRLAPGRAALRPAAFFAPASARPGRPAQPGLRSATLRVRRAANRRVVAAVSEPPQKARWTTISHHKPSPRGGVGRPAAGRASSVSSLLFKIPTCHFRLRQAGNAGADKAALEELYARQQAQGFKKNPDGDYSVLRGSNCCP